MRNASVWIALLVLAGCSPVVGLGGLSGLLGLGLMAGLVFWISGPRSAVAAEPAASAETSQPTGAPMPRPTCDGYEHKSCSQGRISYSCCPKGAKCNYRYSPYQDCGYEQCVQGEDPGMCPPRQPIVTRKAVSEAACKAEHGSWEKACVANKVAMACIMPVPTNYMGPPRNPAFRTCATDRCTTSQFIEDCAPVKADGLTCAAGWTRVCLMGTITERCLPAGMAPTDASKTFVDCGAGKCGIGEDKRVCSASL